MTVAMIDPREGKIIERESENCHCDCKFEAECQHDHIDCQACHCADCRLDYEITVDAPDDRTNDPANLFCTALVFHQVSSFVSNHMRSLNRNPTNRITKVVAESRLPACPAALRR